MRSTKQSSSVVERMREKEIHPAVGIGIILVLIAGLGYAFWLRPGLQAARIKQGWTSPQAAAARSPEGRPRDAAWERAVLEARQREGRR